MLNWQDLWTGKSIGTALAEATKKWGSKEAIIFGSGAVTFAELERMSGLVARGLIALGVRKGNMVAIWMAGYAEWSFIYYACARIGAVMVPVNTRYKPFEVEYVLNKSRATVLIWKDEEEKGKTYLGILKELAPELETSSPGNISVQRLPHLRHVVVIGTKPQAGCSSFDDLLDAGAKVSAKALAQAEVDVSGEDTALIQFTSGTTALPKGAVLYQTAMLRAGYYNSYFLGVTEKDRFFSPQPFYHVGGSIQVMLGPVVLGCTMVIQPYFNAAEALHLMEKYQCTVTMGHQPHWIEYMNHPDLKKRRLIVERAEIFAPPDVRKRVAEEMGIGVLISPYSMTESHIGGCTCRWDDPVEKRLYTVGRPMPGLEVVVRDPETGKILPQGEAGEVCYRGWCVMRGYFDDPELTAEVIDKDGWLRTGDLATIDPDGYVELVGRIKDMIRVGGENVAATEVEGFLLRHEKVKQAVAVGVPEPRLGEIVVAFVELKPGEQPTEAEIIAYCKAGLASFKVPRQIHFVTKWPMTGAGKIQKFRLQELAAKGTG
jgi:acyl-CoA synthetase (AMP-forming)/AMP-acid ligase II